MTRVQKARARDRLSTIAQPKPTKHTGRVRLFTCLAVVIVAFTAFVTPGFAEFESKNTEPKGKGQLYEATFYDGGTTIKCQDPEETLSNIVWTVEKEEKPIKNSTTLRINIEKWASCTYLAASQATGTATLSACELIIEQTAEQNKIPVKFAKECKIAISSCEIKMEPKANQSLSAVAITEDETKAENTLFQPEVAGITAEAGKECGAFGIQTSKAVALKGVGELVGVANNAAPRFHSEVNVIFAVNATNKTNYEFITPAGKVVCTEQITPTLLYVSASPSSNIPTEPKFRGCTFGANPVNNFTCQLLFHATGSLNVTTSCVMEVEGAANCKIKFAGVGANRGLGPVSYTNIAPAGEKKQIEATLAVKNVTFVTTGGACGANGNNGEIVGKSLWKGLNGVQSPVDIKLE